jgi:tyrosinase
MMGYKVSRREFLRLAGLTGLALGVEVFLGGCEPLIDQIANRPVRRNLASLSATDPIIVAYKDAVTQMKSLPASNPRSWAAQAQIHFDHCPHGNWFFLPWHRAYLFYFEKICRELSGMDEFALPYWNWSANPQVPGVFWGGSSNPLFLASRTASQTSTAASEFVGPTVMETILSEPNFLLFASGSATGQRDFSSYGALEGTPHNYIHGFVGGTMGTFQSPLDPVFWTHHNMIDCCWVNWNVDRRNPNTNSPDWINFDFNGNFVDETGVAAEINVLGTLLMPLLSYRYEESAKGSSGSGDAPEISEEALETFLETGADVQVEFLTQSELSQGATVQLNRPLAETLAIDPSAVSSIQEDGEDLRLLLTVGDVDMPGGGDFFVRVFVNKPDATANTSIEDPHYAGSFAFFMDPQHAHQGERPDFIVDLTKTVRRLGGDMDRENVDIQLVPVALPGREPAVQSFGLESLQINLGRVPIFEQ